MAQPEDESQSTRSRFESFGRKLDEAFAGSGSSKNTKIEEEVQKVIAYLNDEVVPQVRQSSSSALRVASEHLNRLAEHLDRSRTPKQ